LCLAHMFVSEAVRKMKQSKLEQHTWLNAVNSLDLFFDKVQLKITSPYSKLIEIIFLAKWISSVILLFYHNLNSRFLCSIIYCKLEYFTHTNSVSFLRNNFIKKCCLKEIGGLRKEYEFNYTLWSYLCVAFTFSLPLLYITFSYSFSCTCIPHFIKKRCASGMNISFTLTLSLPSLNVKFWTHRY